MEALLVSNLLLPDPSSDPSAFLATSMTLLRSSALSALFKTAVKLEASCNPRSADVSSTSLIESA